MLVYLKKHWIEFFWFCIAAGILLVYGPTLGYGFLSWDDQINIYANPYVKTGAFLRFWTNYYYDLYIPIPYSVWTFLYWLGEGSALPFRILSLFLHGVNVFLVGVLLKRFQKILRLESSYFWMFGVLVFALHPLQIEVVAWVTGQRDLLATLFALVALILGLNEKSKISYLCGFFMFVSALLCKPTLAMLPVVLMGIRYLQGAEIKRNILKYSFWMMAPLILYLVNRNEQADLVTKTSSVFEKVIIFFDSIGFYLTKIIFPVSLSTDYGRSPAYLIKELASDWGYVAMGGLVIASLFLLFFRNYRKESTLWGMWIVSLFPVLGLVAFGFQEFSTVADRYNYFPILFFAAAIGFSFSRIKDVRVDQFTRAALIAVFVIFIFLDVKRVPTWENDAAFYSAMTASNEKSFTGWMGLGIVASSKSNHQEALNYFSKAESIRKNDIDALGAVLMTQAFLKNFDFILAKEKSVMVPGLNKYFNPEKSGAGNILAAFGLAHFYRGDRKLSYDYFCLSVKESPNQPTLENYLKRAGIDIHGSAENRCRADLNYDGLAEEVQRF